MNAKELKANLTDRIMDVARQVMEQRANTLQALIKYEIAVINTELAMRSKKHGYDFKFLSDNYANNIAVGAIEAADGTLSMRITIPQYTFKDASPEEVEFFKNYVLRNAVTKLQREK